MYKSKRLAVAFSFICCQCSRVWLVVGGCHSWYCDRATEEKAINSCKTNYNILIRVYCISFFKANFLYTVLLLLLGVSFFQGCNWYSVFPSIALNIGISDVTQVLVLDLFSWSYKSGCYTESESKHATFYMEYDSVFRIKIDTMINTLRVTSCAHGKVCTV